MVNDKIRFVDYFNCKSKKDIKDIYNKSFSKEERIPFWILKTTAKFNNVSLIGILFDNKVIGMEYMIFDGTNAYLMYFALEKHERNKGYGSKILYDLLQKYNNIILSIEKIDSNDKITKKRKEFYLKNGYYETGKFTEQNNVYYELLCSKENFPLTRDKLINIYSKITESKFLRYIINKKFNLNNINFIE